MIYKYKHVIWDWNGTIFNDVDLGVKIMNKLLSERGLKSLTIDFYRDIFTIPVKDYYTKLGFDFSKEPFEVVGKLWIEEYEKRKFECNLYDGIIKVLEKIKNNGIEQSILSAYSQNTLEEMIEHYNLKKYFIHIVGLENIYATSKLHLGIELMKRVRNGKGETLLIGDTLHDYEVATEIGADCILVASGHQSKKVLGKSGAKVINNIKELL